MVSALEPVEKKMANVRAMQETTRNMSWQITRRINIFTPTKSIWAIGLIFECNFLWIGLGLLIIEIEI